MLHDLPCHNLRTILLWWPYLLPAGASRHSYHMIQSVSCCRKEKTTPFGVNLMTSQVLYRAAQGLKDVEVVLARPVVPPVASSLQCISAAVL